MSNFNGNPSSAWTVERVDTLKRMWAEGRSFAEISLELACGLSRNACIGKASRLGLREPGTKRKTKISVRAVATNREGNSGIVARIRARKRQQKQQPEPPTIIELPTPYDFLGIRLLDLQSGQCRFPQGEGANVLFCGSPTVGGTSWCAHCRKIVFSKVTYSDEARKDHGRLIRAAKRAQKRAMAQAQARAA